MKVFEKGRKILRQLQALGYESYFVGGALRDYILGREIHDIDIATPILPHEVMQIFPKTVPIGLKHGTVLVLFEGESFEITTFRTEGAYEDFRHPKEVHFVKDITLDLARRDFTMNAMAMNVDYEWIDPYEGKRDMEKKQVRAVGDAKARFCEDPLRILRGYRFCSQLGFTLEEKTEAAACAHVPLLQHISVERIQVEMEKLLDATYVSEVWDMLEKCKINLHTPIGIGRYPMQTLKNYDFTNLHTIEEKWALFYWALQVVDVFAQLVKWKFSNKKRKGIEALLTMLQIKEDKPLTNYEIYTLGYEMACSFVRVQSVYYKQDIEQNLHKLQQVWSHLSIQNKNELCCDGRMILSFTDQKKGAWLGVLFKDLEKDIVEEKCRNEISEIEEWVREWLQKYK